MPGAHFPANQAASEGGGSGAAAAAPVSGVPNSSPLNLFPQVQNYFEFDLHVFSSYMFLIFFKWKYLQETISGGAGGGLGPLDFLRNSQQVWFLFAF